MLIQGEDLFNLKKGKSIKVTVVDTDRNHEVVVYGKLYDINRNRLKLVGYAKEGNKKSKIDVLQFDLTKQRVYRIETTKIFGKSNFVITNKIKELDSKNN